MVSKVLFSSKSDEWSTPIDLFNALNSEFNFNLDAAATANNHKCDKYFTMEDDGLQKNWGGIECLLILRIAVLMLGLKKPITRALSLIL